MYHDNDKRYDKSPPLRLALSSILFDCFNICIKVNTQLNISDLLRYIFHNLLLHIHRRKGRRLSIQRFYLLTGRRCTSWTSWPRTGQSAVMMLRSFYASESGNVHTCMITCIGFLFFPALMWTYRRQQETLRCTTAVCITRVTV